MEVDWCSCNEITWNECGIKTTCGLLEGFRDIVVNTVYSSFLQLCQQLSHLTRKYTCCQHVLLFKCLNELWSWCEWAVGGVGTEPATDCVRFHLTMNERGSLKPEPCASSTYTWEPWTSGCCILDYLKTLTPSESSRLWMISVALST